MADIALRMLGISKRFPGVLANDSVSLEIRRGEIHGLLGENGAGKTTLMRILYGLIQPDEGTIEIDGRAESIVSPRKALRLGVGMVHQHFMLVPNLTVAENVALGARTDRAFLSPVKRVAERMTYFASHFGFSVGAADLVEELTLGQRQQVEILKLLYRGARVLVLDEPTSSLTPMEWGRLSRLLRSLADQGSAVVFITHKLGELFDVADRCTVLRDGRVVGTVSVAATDESSLARMMVGRDVVLRVERPPSDPGVPVLEVRGLSLVGDDGRLLLNGVDFEVREREIFGVAGVEGNGQNELIEVICGLRRPSAGRILTDGEGLHHPSPRAFTARGAGVIPEDRQRSGVALDMNLVENLIMKEAHTRRFSRRGLLMMSTANDYADQLITEYDIRAPTRSVLMRQLSGGNQQKAVVARELSRRPKLLVAAQPTRGLDVGAMEFVYQAILAHRAAGGATLLISNELDEILSLSDRIAVMVEGRLVRVVEADEVSLETLGLLMAGAEVRI